MKKISVSDHIVIYNTSIQLQDVGTLFIKVGGVTELLKEVYYYGRTQGGGHEDHPPLPSCIFDHLTRHFPDVHGILIISKCSGRLSKCRKR